ncbi:DUF1799 domain-containing protein [Rhizobium sp. 9140]|uniref:DUF1799 domain-containing protein n=1 Tax=Rhizobium sp. 9140 TaxID=1761900 RepID=UPI000B89531F|nr:DUF1799 domain-containing protein [Rhizobium sp. 9140]
MTFVMDDDDAEPNDDEIALVIQNAASLSGFIACSTQWRAASNKNGVLFIGLDYAACKIVLDAEGYEPDVFRDLRVIEDAVLPLFNDGDPASAEDDEE